MFLFFKYVRPVPSAVVASSRERCLREVSEILHTLGDQDKRSESMLSIRVIYDFCAKWRDGWVSIVKGVHVLSAVRVYGGVIIWFGLLQYLVSGLAGIQMGAVESILRSMPIFIGSLPNNVAVMTVGAVEFLFLLALALTSIRDRLRAHESEMRGWTEPVAEAISRSPYIGEIKQASWSELVGKTDAR